MTVLLHPLRIPRRWPRRLRAPFSTQTPKPCKPFDVLFFGRDEFSCLVLEQLYAARDVWDELHIATQPDMKTGRRGSILSVSPLKILGQNLNIPVHTIPPDRPSFKTWQPPQSFLEPLPPPPSRLLVTASFGRILPNALIQRFAPGRKLNVHPSLLPLYRGPAPIQHALLDGQSETGVCVIEMMEKRKGIDAGEVWARETMDVPDDAAFAQMRDALAVRGGRLLVQVLRDMLEGKASSTPQPSDADARRAPLITAEDAHAVFTSMSASDVTRRHRAIAHQKPLFVNLKTDRTLQLHDMSVLERPSDELLARLSQPGMATFDNASNALVVRCAADTVLKVEKVKQQDRALLTSKQWWNGVRPEMTVPAGDGSTKEVVLLL